VLKKVVGISIAAALGIVAMTGLHGVASAADEAKPAAAVDYSKISPADLVKQTPKGQLKDPYKESDAAVVAEGEHLFLSYSCNGCHGGGGGGGMCPPLTNDTWVYGGDDDTLFRLVDMGSDELQKQGYTRKGRENVVGPMPPFGTLIKNSDEVWKILTFVRTKYSENADPKYKYGTPPDQQ